MPADEWVQWRVKPGSDSRDVGRARHCKPCTHDEIDPAVFARIGVRVILAGERSYACWPIQQCPYCGAPMPSVPQQ